MSTSLYDLTPGETFDGLLKTGDNASLTSVLKHISDGLGHDSALQLSTDEVKMQNPSAFGDGWSVSTEQFSFLDGLTSNIQEQINARGAINPTDGFLPYRLSETEFADSNLYFHNGQLDATNDYIRTTLWGNQWGIKIVGDGSSTNNAYVGDYLNQLGAFIQVEDSSDTITISTPNVIQFAYGGGMNGLYVDQVNRNYTFGEFGTGLNSVNISVYGIGKTVETIFEGNGFGIFATTDTETNFRQTAIGDFSGSFNGTAFIINDETRDIYTSYSGVPFGYYSKFPVGGERVAGIGDVDGNFNITNINVDDLGQTIAMTALSIYGFNPAGWSEGINLDFANSTYYFGEFTGEKNGTQLVIADSQYEIKTMHSLIGFGYRSLSDNISNRTAALGDYDNLWLGTKFMVDDVNKSFIFEGDGIEEGTAGAVSSYLKLTINGVVKKIQLLDAS